MPDFIPGLVLSERFYREAVRPLLDRAFPGLPHAAALIGSGSEVLGLDTPMSTDHHWGPRALLFLREPEHASHAAAIVQLLRDRLPHRFLGWPTSFGDPDAGDHGVQLLREADSGPISHRVDVLTLHGFMRGEFGLDLDAAPLHTHDWLTLPSHKLRTLTAGGVFHDDVGLRALRERFAWYPPDVWRFLLASGWARIGQEEHLMGRAGEAGDELGAALIAARLVRDAMRLCFLMSRSHAPYAKWFGLAFAQLPAATPALREALQRVLEARGWRERDAALARVLPVLAAQHNSLQLTEPLDPGVRPFHGRPFRVIGGERFAAALQARITDPALRAIDLPVGSVDQWSDSVEVVRHPQWRKRLLALYREPGAAQGQGPGGP